MKVGVSVCTVASEPLLLVRHFCVMAFQEWYKIRLDHVLVIEMTRKVTHVLLNGISIPPPVISGEMPGG